MATLILTTVGGAVGGPIGAALGGVLGGAIDARLFKPKGRQGPRLTELAVQTSSYGSAIPKLYGTMRVAGSVIWATDLQEMRSSSGGDKGRPSSTSYSYSASFAVLLSARTIQNVSRIWADGKLLRGSAGDFKSATGFRLHKGGETQLPDPLIASAEGAGLAPAHRGCAYAVFEDFQLADYGNRIPSLTFEVAADPGPVASGTIAADASGGRVTAEAGSVEMLGFSAYGDSVRGMLETLATASGAWFAADGARVAMRTDDGAAVELADAGFGASAAGGTRGVRSIGPIDAVPRSLTIAHYDPARDYQAGLQRARRPGAGAREERVEIPAAIDAAGAKTMAEAALARAETGRERRHVALSVAELAVAPGDRVTIAGEAGRWRIAGWTLEAMVLTLDLVRIARATAVATASPGRVLGAPDRVHGASVLHAFEMPGIDEAPLTAPRLTVAAAGQGPGWRQAALLLSLDEGLRWTSAGAATVPATLGEIAVPPAAGAATLIDSAAALEVVLAHDGMTLNDADADALDAGINLAMAGEELIQFGRAVRIDARRWRLDRLLRGRRGTEAAAGTQAPGDRFVLLERDALISVELPADAIGATARVLASSVGDLDGPAAASAAIAGVSVRPPSPVHLRWTEAAGGDAEIGWIRRSRAGWRWIDGIDAPLAEERERYRVSIQPAGGTVREVETGVAALTLTAAERAVPLTVQVRQVGTWGDSGPVTIGVPAL